MASLGAALPSCTREVASPSSASPSTSSSSLRLCVTSNCSTGSSSFPSWSASAKAAVGNRRRTSSISPLPAFGASSLPSSTAKLQPSRESLALRSAFRSAPSIPDWETDQDGPFAMRHGRRVTRLERPADQRKALLRGLTRELSRHGRIKTTKTRARAMRKYVDHMITLAKAAEVPDRYGERNGGYYTRISRTMPRRGDNKAPMAFIELV